MTDLISISQTENGGMKMRLIDADALKDFLIRAGRFLKGQDDKRTAAHAIGKIIEHIDSAPTIDAIPVEWLEERKRWASADGDNECVWVIEYLIDRWQKEQEAR